MRILSMTCRALLAISITTTGVMAQSWDVDNEKPPAIGSERARLNQSDQQPSLDYPCQVRVSGDSCRITVDLVIDERQRWPVACEFQTFDSIIVGTFSLLSTESDVPKPYSRIATTGEVLWLKLHYLTDTASYRLMYTGERWQADCVCRQPFVYMVKSDPGFEAGALRTAGTERTSKFDSLHVMAGLADRARLRLSTGGIDISGPDQKGWYCKVQWSTVAYRMTGQTTFGSYLVIEMESNR